MSKFISGNYQLEKEFKTSGNSQQAENFSEVFESSALEKLGGSIAFVLKSDRFVWGDEDADSN